MPRKPLVGIDYVTRDYEGFRELMLEQLSLKMPEYTDRSKTDAGIVLLELNAIALDILSYYIDSIANEVFFTTAQQRSSVLEWCKLLGYTPLDATPAKFMQVFRLVKEKSNALVIPKGTVVTTDPTVSEDVVYYETDEDLTIPAGKLGDEQDEGGYLYAVSITQGSTVTDELLGTSTGAADQSFILRNFPALAYSIKLNINEGFGFSGWERVDSFIDSEASSRHFMAVMDEYNRTKIVFGNGVFGKIPTAYPNGLYCTYRIGGGTEGNAGIGNINTVDSNLAEIRSTFNPALAYSVGTSKETLASIKANAISSLRTNWGALTLTDFASVVKANFPAVKFAKAYRNAVNGDDVDLYLHLDPSYGVTFASVSTELSDFFDPNEGGKTVVGVGEVNVFEAVGQALALDIVLHVRNDYARDPVLDEIGSALDLFFAPGNFDIQASLALRDLDAYLEENVRGIKYIQCKDRNAPNALEIIPEDGKYFIAGGVNSTNVTGGIIIGVSPE